MNIKTTVLPFGEVEGNPVYKYIIADPSGMQVTVMNYGATITNIIVPDKDGNPCDVILGFETIDGYVKAGDIYMGSICGRYANRIGNAKFSIDSREYYVSANKGKNSLHGGFKGFDKMIWNAEPLDAGVKFNYTSKDGEEGYPGNLKISVTYTVSNNTLQIEYMAVTDKSTPVNLTSHCYFNLSGGEDDTILNHELQLNADRMVEVDDESIPTGRLTEIKNTGMDFTSLKKIGQDIEKPGGYDYCWVLNKADGGLFKAARLFYKKTAIEMTMHTTEPAVQFYSSNYFTGNMADAKNAMNYGKYAGLCLEAQHFPDSPNHSNFPATILKPGELYRQTTIYSFETIK